MPILSHHLNVKVNVIVERMYNEITRSELMVSPDPGGVLTIYFWIVGGNRSSERICTQSWRERVNATHTDLSRSANNCATYSSLNRITPDVGAVSPVSRRWV